ncbi:MAG TPA: patatin family protein [Erysipelothrix sp.]|jgi:predicted patatin/cPLA2 family phospholipase|nr:patatin family protein [Erysipelothrix sp.]
MKKVGIVLEGGGMRGAYTAGVLSWLIDNKFVADVVVGISSGAMYGAFYCVEDPSLLKKASIEIAPDKENVGIRPLFREGQLVAYDRLYDEEMVNAGFDNEKLRHSKSDLQVGVYSLEEYKTLWKDQYDIADEAKWIKAACALPVWGRFVPVKGVNYTDGGITTMIPVKRAMDVECNRFLVVTTKSPEFVRKPFPRWQIWLLNNVIYRKHRKMVKDFDARTRVYYEERQLVDKLVDEKKAINLYPTKETGVSRYTGSRDQFEALFDLAYENCETQRAEITDLFEKP